MAGSLAEAVLRGVFLRRLKLGAALFLLVGALASGTGLAARFLPASAPAEQGRPTPLVARKAEEPPPPPEPEEREKPGSHDEAVAKLEAMSPERWEQSWKTDLDVTDQPAGVVLRRLTRELGLSIKATAEQERDLERPIRLKLEGRSRLEMVEEVCRCVGLYPVYSHDVASHGEYGKTIRLRNGPRPSPVTFAGPFRVTVEDVETKPASGTGELQIRFLALGLPPAVALPLKHGQPIRVEQVAGPGGQALFNPDKKPSWTGTDTYTGFDQTQYLELKNLGHDGAVLRTLAGIFRVPIASRVESAHLAPLKTGTDKSIGDMRVTLEKISTRREVIDDEEPQERRDYDVHFRGIDLFRLELIGHDAHGRLLRTVFHQGWGDAKNEGHKVIGFTRPPASITAKALAELKFREYPFRLENVPLSARDRKPDQKAGPPRGVQLTVRPEDEAAALAGIWTAVAYTGDGEGGYLPSAQALPTGKLLLRRNDGSREEFREGPSTWQNSWTDYRVDPSQAPHAIDFILRDPYDHSEIVYPGIYERKGDTLRICRTIQMYGPRPTKFEAVPGSRKILAVWKRH